MKIFYLLLFKKLWVFSFSAACCKIHQRLLSTAFRLKCCFLTSASSISFKTRRNRNGGWREEKGMNSKLLAFQKENITEKWSSLLMNTYRWFWLAASLKLDTLSECQVGAVVDSDGWAPHILLPGVRPGLPPSSCVLLSPKRTSNLSSVGRDVDVHNAAVWAFRTDPLEK